MRLPSLRRRVDEDVMVLFLMMGMNLFIVTSDPLNLFFFERRTVFSKPDRRLGSGNTVSELHCKKQSGAQI